MIKQYHQHNLLQVGLLCQKNVTVTNGAKLTFNAGESVTINTPFTVNAGSQIEISAN